MSISIITTLLVGALIFVGFAIHEFSHWFFGFIFGAKPYPSIKKDGIYSRPQIKFLSSEKLGPWQVRITSSFVPMLSLLICGFALWYQSLFIAAITFGSSRLSALDMIALRDPDIWKKIDAGKTIQPGDL